MRRLLLLVLLFSSEPFLCCCLTFLSTWEVAWPSGQSVGLVTRTASWICFTENLSFKSSATLVSSQLVCLRPVGILNPVMFNLYVDLIIYSMALKSPDGELSLEIVFF